MCKHKVANKKVRNGAQQHHIPKSLTLLSPKLTTPGEVVTFRNFDWFHFGTSTAKAVNAMTGCISVLLNYNLLKGSLSAGDGVFMHGKFV